MEHPVLPAETSQPPNRSAELAAVQNSRFRAEDVSAAVYAVIEVLAGRLLGVLEPNADLAVAESALRILGMNRRDALSVCHQVLRRTHNAGGERGGNGSTGSGSARASSTAGRERDVAKG